MKPTCCIFLRNLSDRSLCSISTSVHSWSKWLTVRWHKMQAACSGISGRRQQFKPLQSCSAIDLPDNMQTVSSAGRLPGETVLQTKQASPAIPQELEPYIYLKNGNKMFNRLDMFHTTLKVREKYDK